MAEVDDGGRAALVDAYVGDLLSHMDEKKALLADADDLSYCAYFWWPGEPMDPREYGQLFYHAVREWQDERLRKIRMDEFEKAHPEILDAEK